MPTSWKIFNRNSNIVNQRVELRCTQRMSLACNATAPPAVGHLTWVGFAFHCHSTYSEDDQLRFGRIPRISTDRLIRLLVITFQAPTLSPSPTVQLLSHVQEGSDPEMSQDAQDTASNMRGWSWLVNSLVNSCAHLLKKPCMYTSPLAS